MAHHQYKYSLQKFYVVEAIRKNTTSATVKDSYVVGVYESKDRAEYAGEVEKSWRGGMFDYDITEHSLDYISLAKIEDYIKNNGSEIPDSQYDD